MCAVAHELTRNISLALVQAAMCPDGAGMIRLLELLKDGVDITYGKEKAKLSLMRAKNKFRDGGSCEATRFRSVLTNAILTYDGRDVFCELQVRSPPFQRLCTLLVVTPSPMTGAPSGHPQMERRVPCARSL